MKAVAAAAPTRPALRYFGGKWMLAPWLISLFPEHRLYVEPFGGGASVLLRKPRSNAEVYNDLDGDVVNLFRVLRNPDSALELMRQVELTPFAREEFEAAAVRDIDDPVERARRTVARSFMGFGSNALSTHHTGFRSRRHTERGNNAARDWSNWPAAVPAMVERLRGVVIEREEALDIIRSHDSADALFYVDPPYPHSTVSGIRWPSEATARGYRHTLSDEDHRELGAVLHRIQGAAIVSGYRCDLYDEVFGDWKRLDRGARADGGRHRKESVWLNDQAQRGQRQITELGA